MIYIIILYYYIILLYNVSIGIVCLFVCLVRKGGYLTETRSGAPRVSIIILYVCLFVCLVCSA